MISVTFYRQNGTSYPPSHHQTYFSEDEGIHFFQQNILRYYFYAYYHKTFIKWSGIHLIFDLLDRAFIREGSSFRGGAF